jgi:hypothetical protein
MVARVLCYHLSTQLVLLATVPALANSIVTAIVSRMLSNKKDLTSAYKRSTVDDVIRS